MNRLTTEDRARILTVLSEGVGINAACRMTGASKNTVLKLMADVGEACSLYQHRVMRNLQCTQIQVDEIWSFVGMKQKNAPEGVSGVWVGDCYTFTAIDPVTKLMPCWRLYAVSCGTQRSHFVMAGANGWAGRCLSLDMRK